MCAAHRDPEPTPPRRSERELRGRFGQSLPSPLELLELAAPDPGERAMDPTLGAIQAGVAGLLAAVVAHDELQEAYDRAQDGWDRADLALGRVLEVVRSPEFDVPVRYIDMIRAAVDGPAS